jgi:hypothetical protein
MKTKPFNLSEAIAGKIVVDQEGRKGKWVYTMNNPTSAHGGKKHVFSFNTEEGREYLVSTDDTGGAVLTKEFIDKGVLRMECKQTEYWIATGISSITKDLYSTRPRSVEDDAISDLRYSIALLDDTLQTHKITRYE